MTLERAHASIPMAESTHFKYHSGRSRVQTPSVSTSCSILIVKRHVGVPSNKRHAAIVEIGWIVGRKRQLRTRFPPRHDDARGEHREGNQPLRAAIVSVWRENNRQADHRIAVLVEIEYLVPRFVGHRRNHSNAHHGKMTPQRLHVEKTRCVLQRGSGKHEFDRRARLRYRWPWPTGSRGSERSSSLFLRRRRDPCPIRQHLLADMDADTTVLALERQDAVINRAGKVDIGWQWPWIEQFDTAVPDL